MNIDYYSGEMVNEAKIAAKAVGMVIVGSAMILGGLSILDTLLSKENTWR